MSAQLILKAGTIELWTEGLDDPGPEFKIFARCSYCGVILHSRTFSATADKEQAFGAVHDAMVANAHSCAEKN